MSLAALASGLIILGTGLGAPELPGMITRAAEARGFDLSLDSQPFPAALQLTAETGHVLLSPTESDAARWHVSLKGISPGTKVWVMPGWPSLPAQTGTPGISVSALAQWHAQLQTDTAAARARASALSPEAQIIPLPAALAMTDRAARAGELPGLSGVEGLYRADGQFNDRGLYLATLTTLSQIEGAAPEAVPPQLNRLWMSRQSVISPALAEALQRIAWEAVRAEALAPPPVETAPARVAEAAAPGETAGLASDSPPAAPLPPEGRPALDDGGVTAPGIAFNLAELADWSAQLPFLDLMKTARPWTGHKIGQWGGYDHDALAAGGFLDAAGWPRSLPPDASGLSTLFLTDLPPEAGGVAGRYHLSHHGRAKLQLSGPIKIVSEQPGEVVFDYSPGPGGVILTLSEIAPEDPIRAITILREDRRAAHAAGEIFNPDWLARIRGAKMLRFMDWGQTNHTRISGVSDQPRLSDYAYTWRGAPVEVMLRLANTLGTDAWFTLPHLADDDLARAYARQVHAGLGPGQTAYVEFSNEVWNHMFPQAAWAEAEGRARWGQEWKWVQFYAMRAAEVARIWAEVFVDDPSRLVRVLVTQTGWMGLEIDILDAPLVQAEGKEPPHRAFDVLGVTGYVSGAIGNAEKRALLGDWLARSRAAAEAEGARLGHSGQALADHVARHRFDLAVDLAIEEMRDGRHSGNPHDTLEFLYAELLPWQAAAAAKRGLGLVMYEGGTHAVGLGAPREEEEVTAFLLELNYSAGMGRLYRDLIDRWQKLSPAPFAAFVDVATPSKYGSWGALRHLGDDNPRWRALAKGANE